MTKQNVYDSHEGGSHRGGMHRRWQGALTSWHARTLGDYRPTALGTVSKPLTIGLVPLGGDELRRQLIRYVRDSLISSYNAKVILPYLPGSSRAVDIVTTLSVKPKYEGSGWNFLVNFPGFLCSFRR